MCRGSDDRSQLTGVAPPTGGSQAFTRDISAATAANDFSPERTVFQPCKGEDPMRAHAARM